jgi:hypothetical protein
MQLSTREELPHPHRRVRILSVMDAYTRECLALEAET